jgi:antitoxin HicB
MRLRVQPDLRVDKNGRVSTIAEMEIDRAVDLTRTFTIVLEPEEEGGFTVRVPALPEIVSYGNDEQEALEMAKDAIRLVLEDRAARGEPIPNGEAARIREVTVTLAA